MSLDKTETPGPADPDQTPKPVRGFRLVVFLAFTGVILTLIVIGAVELLLRQTGTGEPVPSLNPKIYQPDPQLGVVLKPGWTGQFAGVEVSTNSLGLRGPELDPLGQDQHRILLAGDSFVFGYGLKEEETLRNKMEESFRATSKGKDICVINGGVPGYNLVQDVSWTLQIGLAQQPDWVILFVVPNDLEPPLWLDPKTRPDTGGAMTWLDWIKGDPRLMEFPGARKMNLLNLLQRISKVLLPSQRSLGEDYFRFCNEVLFSTTAWPQAQAALLKLEAVLRGAGIPLTVVLYPVPVSLQKAPFGPFNENVIQFCKDSSINVLDFTVEWAEIPENKLRWHPDDLHPSGFAHARMAEALLRICPIQKNQ